jgi:uncharacterized protein (DUF488 family)
MFYRKKITLALIEIFGGEIDKLKFQKLLFLLSELQSNPLYHFVPYKYGCFSFTANLDITSLINKGIILEKNNKLIKLDKNKTFFEEIKNEDKEILIKIKNEFEKFSTEDLIKYTYNNFPYYAIKSEIKNKYLNQKEIDKFQEKKLKNDNETLLFTIGYEGLSIEEYLNKLIKNNIPTLIDVRNNPVSMKYGFSKNQLNQFCNNLNIKFVHIPEVGIPSILRKNLKNQNDYDALFINYKNNILSQTKNYQLKILSLLKEYKRVAITCFEADVNQCHRFHLANEILHLSKNQLKIIHI